MSTTPKTENVSDFTQKILEITRSTADLPCQKKANLAAALAVQRKTVKQTAQLLEKEAPTGWKEAIAGICNLTGYGYKELGLQGKGSTKILTIGCKEHGLISSREIWDKLLKEVHQEVVSLKRTSVLSAS